METSEAHLSALFLQQRGHLRTMAGTGAGERRERLRRLLRYLESHTEEARNATWQDFRKPPFETDLTEIFTLTSEIRYVLRHLATWMKPHRVPSPLSALGTQGHIRYQAKGNALIISPWNYPISLALKPLVSAIAAGCTAVIKPSELTPCSSAFIRRMIEELFPPEEVSVVEGGVGLTQQLLKLPFNHIFFTGSPEVGKIVMRAAADHLASVTLELGGKSPAIIDETAPVAITARNIAWAKFLNCGQTCIAPDYLFVHRSVLQPFIVELRNAIAHMYPPVDNRATANYGRIVNEKHFDRLEAALSDALQKGAEIVAGGKKDRDSRYIEPTVLTGVRPDMTLLKEEIFGPLLPVYAYGDLEEAVEYINEREPPLALYIHTKSKKAASYVLSGTRSGNALVNEMITQFGHHEIPFGGVNHSGIGKSNGFFGFREFSNPKGIIKRRFGTIRFLYPPYNDNSNRMIRWMTKFL